MKITDTIAAVSTPYGKGGIAVIRVSGADAAVICERLFVPIGKKRLFDKPNICIFGKIMSATGECVDEGMAVYFRAPHSFTGEDTVEISCHGGVLVTQKVLSTVLAAGARAAEAGEFTRRAYVNGKMRLTQAEALGNLLEAQTDAQVRLAGSGMRGVLTEKTSEIYDSLSSVLAAVYAKIDYPDEDLAEIGEDEMQKVISENIQKLQRLMDSYRTGRAIAEGVPTTIAGRTNAGKSSLYNRLVGRDAAIVTNIEGTTRDVLTETVTAGKVLLRLSDTAGLRMSDDEVERIGIERAREHIREAELVIALFDGTSEPTEEDVSLADQLLSKEKVCIAVLNKSDASDGSAYEDILSKFQYKTRISAKTGAGIDELKEMIEEIYIDCELDAGKDAIIANSRQYAAIFRAYELLCETQNAIASSYPLEVICSTAEEAMGAVGELDGRTVSEDIISKIFSKFCVGK